MQVGWSTRLRVAVRVATETGLVDFGVRRAAFKKNDMTSISSIDMGLSGTVAGFTGTIFPTLIRLHIKNLVGVGCEFRRLSLMTGRAGG